jgi:hypothetical protein
MKKHKKGGKGIFGKGAQRFGPNEHSSLNKENAFVTKETKGKKKHKRGHRRG